jgi:hypothetical protein
MTTKVLTFFLKKKNFGSPQQLRANDYQSSQGRSAQQGRQKQREKITIRDYIWTLQKPFNLSGFYLLT